MREIKFRGKRIDNGEWVYGGYSFCEKDNTHWITVMGLDHISHIGWHQEVVPETVGQFTGLLDGNGKEIYEGDILKNVLNIMVDHEPFEIVFDNDMGCWCWADAEGNIDPFYSSIAKNSVVIGNIHDNPELIPKEIEL